MSQVAIQKVQNFLSELQNKQGVKFDFRTAGLFAANINSAVTRQLSPDLDRGFKLRMSNLGRPSCILQAEKLGYAADTEPYSNRFRNLFGDLIEQAAVLIMKAAGVNVVAEQGGVAMEMAGAIIEGTYDIVLAEPDRKVYDIKSASGYTFKNKYNNTTLQTLWDDGDSFGYVTQVYLYSQALGIPCGGLIVISKETGEWTLVPPPTDDTALREACLRRATSNVLLLTSKEPFKKCFTDMPEMYRKKETGNRVLGFDCAFCKFKSNCWPDVVEKPQVVSHGQHPRMINYTYLKEEYKND